MKGKRMQGTVIGYSGYYFQVDCPNAPSHLSPLFLTSYQLMGAKVGDKVILEYQVTPSSGLWNVVEIVTL